MSTTTESGPDRATEIHYKGTDGQPITLAQLCRIEPDWAASRIVTLLEEVAVARGKLHDLQARIRSMGED